MNASDRRRNKLLKKAKKFRFAFKAGIDKFIPRQNWPLRDLSCCYGGELVEMIGQRSSIALLMLAEITRAHVTASISDKSLVGEKLCYEESF